MIIPKLPEQSNKLRIYLQGTVLIILKQFLVFLFNLWGQNN